MFDESSLHPKKGTKTAQISASKVFCDAPTSNLSGCYCCCENFSNRSPYKNEYPDTFIIQRVVRTKDTFICLVL